jgi:hypothetical protein
MLQKRPLAGRKVEVTFRMPPMDDVVELYLCGDFNAWHARDLPLTVESDGTWVGRLVLDAGKSYRFRYRDNQGCWHTDYEADGHVTNAFGGDDSVVDLTMATEEPPRARAPKQAAAPSAGSGRSRKVSGRRQPRAHR